MLTGTPSVFVRVSGCNLRCDFCDTPYTSWNPEGEDQSVEQVVSHVTECECAHVVLTGGEPMLFAEVAQLSHRLRAAKRHLTIETAGTVDRPVDCDLMSISPKRANSTPSFERAGKWRERHERSRHAPHVINRLIRDYAYQIKFVICHETDLDDVQAYLDEFPGIERSRTLLMPEGTTIERLADVSAWLVDRCRALGFVFCPRKHIEWFGNVRGT